MLQVSWRVAWLVSAVVCGCSPYNDDGAICGPEMQFDAADGVCICNDHAVAAAGACVACADDEIVVGTACACAPAETKNADGVCAPTPGLGSACGATTACPDAMYDYCAIRDGSGACTKRCTVDTDCPDTYVCADWEAVPSCRVYTGYGATCAISDDCASYDADYCIQGHCDVHGCTVGVDDCPRGTMCCDLTSYGFGTLCSPAELCP